MRSPHQVDELKEALSKCKVFVLGAALFSAGVNLLYLTPTIYLMQVYDRVLASTSVPTLVFLTLIVVVALATLAALDLARAQLLTRMGVRLDRMLSGRVYQSLMTRAISGAEPVRSQAVRDFDGVRQFLTANTIHVAFDAPWTPIYIIVAFMLHPLIGSLCLIFALMLIGLAILNEVVSRGELKEANAAALKNYAFTEMSLRNAEVVQALGMFAGVFARWQRDRTRLIDSQARASIKASYLTSLIRFLRLCMQSIVLGVGAYLVIERSLSPGAIFASTVLLGRALQPIEQAVGAWRQAVGAWQSYQRLAALLGANPARPPATRLPEPRGALSVEKVSFAISQRSEPILKDVTFRLAAGEAVAIIGPSASGKSTLARILVGVLSPSAGHVRIDGADVWQWPRNQLGQYLGYLPQDIELFSGTVAENIGRFEGVGSDAIIEAAQLAGVHEMILRLPQAYETHIGENGNVLSGGQRQRIALARAALRSPRLLVLDEPNSNLDSVGEASLSSCLMELKSRGATIVLISHRLTALNFVDKILVLNNGVVEAFGPRAEILARLGKPAVVRPSGAPAAMAAAGGAGPAIRS